MATRDITSGGLKIIETYEHPPVIENGRCYPYGDGTGKHKGGVPTIGYGHKILPGETRRFKDGITVAEAVALLHSDVQKFVNEADRLAPAWLNTNQFDAIVSLIFNTGVQPLIQGHLHQYLQANEPIDAAQQFQMWCNAEINFRFGPIQGLFYRRLTETIWFLGGELMFAHNWNDAKPIMDAIKERVLATHHVCTVPHYGLGDFVG